MKREEDEARAEANRIIALQEQEEQRKREELEQEEQRKREQLIQAGTGSPLNETIQSVDIEEALNYVPNRNGR